MPTWTCRTVPPRLDPDARMERFFEWAYDGRGWEWSMRLPRQLYDAHRRRERIYTYGSYVADSLTQRALATLCKHVSQTADAEGFQRADVIAFVSRFVQHLPYTPDDVSTDYSNYPRYPIETLVDETGDCEDSSLLLAAILHELGVEVALVEFPTHLGVGVVTERWATNVEHEGTGYTYIETTGDGWTPGTIPPRYADQRVTVHTVTDAPALYADWRAAASDGQVRATGTLANLGSGAAGDVRLRVRLERPDGTTAARIVKSWATIEDGDDVSWSGTQAIDADGSVTPAWTVSIGGRIHDRGSLDRNGSGGAD